ncbi:MAG TPA: glycoside hydrolase family 2 TIM barrel-domain containing protein, partial [Niabella sp.]
MKKQFYLTAVFFLGIFVTKAAAQQSVRLISNWQFLRQDLGGIWEAVRPEKKGYPETVPLWTAVTLPHCANERDAVDPDVNYYEGPMWYKTRLEVNNPYTKGRTLLHFEGAGQKSAVYVYTTKVGTHVGGYDEWTVDITDAVNAFKKNDSLLKAFKGKIPVAVRCDNSRDLEMMPSDLADFNLYGGLYRYVNLVYEPALYIDRLFASPVVAANGRFGSVNVKLRFSNTGTITAGQLSISLKDPSGKELQRVQKKMDHFDGDMSVADLSVKNPQLWSPDQPVLYTIEATVTTTAGAHTSISRIGFRSFEFVKKGPFLLNGKRLLLRGTHRHEDHAGLAAAMTEDLMRQEMISMKEMGVNFIRLGHYQQSRIILNLCDSLGILVWEEIPWCRGGLGGPVYQAQGKRMLTNMIEQHYNHPAVMIWGLGNENDWPNDFPVFDKEKIRAYMKELNTLAHALDPSRKTAIRRCDFCKDIVDVYSHSIWAGWYRGIYTEYKEVTKAEFDKVDHFLHVEWGGD